MTDLNPTSIRWPLASIDFEASGLGEGTYPIEVGLAVWHGPDTPIRTWSTLIAPTPDWVARGVWKSEAESVHKIDRGSLHRSEEHTSELQSLMRISYAVFCLKRNTKSQTAHTHEHQSNIPIPQHVLHVIT